MSSPEFSNKFSLSLCRSWSKRFTIFAFTKCEFLARYEICKGMPNATYFRWFQMLCSSHSPKVFKRQKVRKMNTSFVFCAFSRLYVYDDMWTIRLREHTLYIVYMSMATVSKIAQEFSTIHNYYVRANGEQHRETAMIEKSIDKFAMNKQNIQGVFTSLFLFITDFFLDAWLSLAFSLCTLSSLRLRISFYMRRWKYQLNCSCFYLIFIPRLNILGNSESTRQHSAVDFHLLFHFSFLFIREQLFSLFAVSSIVFRQFPALHAVCVRFCKCVHVFVLCALLIADDGLGFFHLLCHAGDVFNAYKCGVN